MYRSGWWVEQTRTYCAEGILGILLRAVKGIWKFDGIRFGWGGAVSTASLSGQSPLGHRQIEKIRNDPLHLTLANPSFWFDTDLSSFADLHPQRGKMPKSSVAQFLSAYKAHAFPHLHILTSTQALLRVLCSSESPSLRSICIYPLDLQCLLHTLPHASSSSPRPKTAFCTRRWLPLSVHELGLCPLVSCVFSYYSTPSHYISARSSILTVLETAISIGHLTITDSEGTHYYGKYRKGCNDVHLNVVNDTFWLRILL